MHLTTFGKNLILLILIGSRFCFTYYLKYHIKNYKISPNNCIKNMIQGAKSRGRKYQNSCSLQSQYNPHQHMHYDIIFDYMNIYYIFHSFQLWSRGEKNSMLLYN